MTNKTFDPAGRLTVSRPGGGITVVAERGLLPPVEKLDGTNILIFAGEEARAEFRDWVAEQTVADLQEALGISQGTAGRLRKALGLAEEYDKEHVSSVTAWRRQAERILNPMLEGAEEMGISHLEWAIGRQALHLDRLPGVLEEYPSEKRYRDIDLPVFRVMWNLETGEAREYDVAALAEELECSRDRIRSAGARVLRWLRYRTRLDRLRVQDVIPPWPGFKSGVHRYVVHTPGEEKGWVHLQARITPAIREKLEGAQTMEDVEGLSVWKDLEKVAEFDLAAWEWEETQ
jgi:hypothetical protein